MQTRSSIGVRLGIVACLSICAASRSPIVAAPREAPVPAETSDPAFDRFIDLSLAGRAWATRDAGLLTDVALQLAEGERVLLRSHKAFTAASLLEKAVQLAAEKKDTAALDRLAKVADRRGDTSLQSRLSAARKLLAAPRSTESETSVPIADTSIEDFVYCRAMLDRIRVAQSCSDLTALETIQKDLDRRIRESPQSSAKDLQRVLADSRASIGRASGPDRTAMLLEKLAAPSRYGALVGRWRSGQRVVEFSPNGQCQITLPDGRKARFTVAYNPDTGAIVGTDEEGGQTEGRIRWHSPDSFTWYGPSGYLVYYRDRGDAGLGNGGPATAGLDQTAGADNGPATGDNSR